MQNQTNFQFAPLGFVNQNDVVTTEISARNLDPRPGVRMSTVALPSNLLFFAQSIARIMQQRNAVMTQLEGFSATFANFETDAEGQERAKIVQDRLLRRRNQFSSELTQAQDMLRSVQNELQRLDAIAPVEVRSAPMVQAMQEPAAALTGTLSWDMVNRTDSGLT